MSTFLFIRHASHGLLGKRFVARTPGVMLSEQGEAEALTLAERLQHLPIEAIYSSPLERAQQTAQPLAERLKLAPTIREELNEIDIGDWTNCTMDAIDEKPGWSDWNTFRSCARPPGGELMLEAQARVVSLVSELRAKHPGALVALFSHGDIVKGALAHYLGVHLDLFHRIDIDPASVSVVRIENWGPRVLRVNDTGALHL